MKLSKNYIQSKDIDWFCCIDDIYIHVASAGGELPDIVNDYNKLRGIQEAASKLPDIYKDEEIEINDTFIRSELEKNIRQLREKDIYYGNYDINKGVEDYTSTFKIMARKGFTSYDRTHISELEDNHYHWVARPRKVSSCPQINIPMVRTNNSHLQNNVDELDLINLLRDAKVVR